MKIDREIRRQRMKVAGIGLGLAAAVATLAILVSLDTAVTTRRVPGKVARVEQSAAKTGQNALLVDIDLDGGGHAQVLVKKDTDPKTGDKVEITEHKSALGRVNYSWK